MNKFFNFDKIFLTQLQVFQEVVVILNLDPLIYKNVIWKQVETATHELWLGWCFERTNQKCCYKRFPGSSGGTTDRWRDRNQTGNCSGSNWVSSCAILFGSEQSNNKFFLLSDSNSQAQARKKLRKHSSTMFVAKCCLINQKFEDIFDVMSKQFMNVTFVESAWNGNIGSKIIFYYHIRIQKSALNAKFARKDSKRSVFWKLTLTFTVILSALTARFAGKDLEPSLR